ncbi:MAG: RNA polymerase sigma factor [Gaiellaceae bacterium]
MGDRSFERLYERHVREVYRYTLAVLRNPADAEDATQTTFLNAYRAHQRGEVPRKPSHWLIAIAHNVCRARFRHNSRRPQQVAFDEAPAAPVAEDVVDLGQLRQALDQLGFNQRSALVMRELEGRSYKEIAAVLGVSVSAVETLIFRARRTLREHLEEPLTCPEAAKALAREGEGLLPADERGALRAHLRGCADCATLARSQRASRTAGKGLAGAPLLSGLASVLGSGGAFAGAAEAGLAGKAGFAAALVLLVARAARRKEGRCAASTG